MAIYNPKRARELEAAARLAESQRQREMAKGQREQRTTEQILGLVEGLIGAAPQVVGGLQDLQAQQVLAGEKPLPEQKPKSDDILENISRFITDPFDAGVRQRVKQMAAEQKGPRLHMVALRVGRWQMGPERLQDTGTKTVSSGECSERATAPMLKAPP